ncbi:hypothetical protein [Streptomyces sp. RTd22]|uniref:hypothetical protein n=1 Tax=Streptomyces sp. RTd22 TaxID=1841249 RepID=UPI0007C4B7D8|nr:hypothetical protein [Streptomyces sp. RTd22]
MGDATKRALNSIRELLPPHLAHRLAAYSIEQIENAWELAPPQVDPTLLAQLSTAAQQRDLVRFSYRTITLGSMEDSDGPAGAPS